MDRRCQKCGCALSSYTPISDRYCHPCHPRLESIAAAATCRKGHDRSVYGVIRKGRWDCRECENERHRARRKAKRNGQ
jgi:hypothetical protein